MTLYIKGTDIKIIGTLETVTVLAHVPGLTDDGVIRWTGHQDPRDDSETVLRDSAPVWISEDGSEYATTAVEDRRDDGTVIDYQPLMPDPVRPVTKQIQALWRHDVIHHLTTLGAKEWGEQMTVRDWLGAHGLQLRERDPELDVGTEGIWQISHPYPAFSNPREDSHNFFGVVGNNADDLFAQAIQHITRSS